MDVLATDPITLAERELTDRTLKIGAGLTLGGATLGALATRTFYGTLAGVSVGSLAASATAYWLTQATVTTPEGAIEIRPVKLAAPFAVAGLVAGLVAYALREKGKRR